MIYAIWATEGFYGGLHGVESFLVDDFDSLEDAEETAEEMSYSLIEDYSLSQIEEDSTDQEIDDFFAENIEYQIFEVVDTHGKTISEMDTEIAEEGEIFLEQYCREVDNLLL